MVSPQASRTRPCAQSAQRPQRVATPSVDWRSASERAPRAMAPRTSWSLTALQMQMYTCRLRSSFQGQPPEANASTNRSHYHIPATAAQVRPSDRVNFSVRPVFASMPLPELSLLECRVLGVLVEKQKTVPDTYPLTLNALVAGCTQKTSRDPVIEASDADVQSAVDHLRQLSLVVESSGGRVMRYAQNVARVLSIPTESVALLATLMLRGPQTPGEIRINCDRLHRFADISSVEAYLSELAGRPAGALVQELARMAGSRETRWTHLLSGEPAQPSPPAPRVQERSMADDELTSLRQEVAALARDVATLKAMLAKLTGTP